MTIQNVVRGLVTVVLSGLGIGVAAAQQVDPSWLTVNAPQKRVTVELIAGLQASDSGFDFNGFRNGGLTLTVPRDWRVVLHFRNNDAKQPHSAEVIWEVQPVPAGPTRPAFTRSFTPRLAVGTAPQGRDSASFVADARGNLIMYCPVQGHGTHGQWIRMVVADKKQVPVPTLRATAAGGS